jgi:NTE family protein
MRALVLGGGGVTGIAWELGVIAGLVEQGVHLAEADLFVGTSAGSVVASLLSGGRSPQESYAAQLEPAVSEEKARLGKLLLLRYLWTMASSKDTERFGAKMGALALGAKTGPAHARREVIASRLPDLAWPERPLKVTAVDAESGKFTVFDSGSGVELIDAVSASCAVPGVWPAAEINGRRYIDGGMRSAANADLASGYEQVVVVAPLVRGAGPMVPVTRQVERLREEGARVLLIKPDIAALNAIGKNVLDPGRRRPAAEAGFAQAKLEAAAAAEVWG